jgi:hypothetical protein
MFDPILERYVASLTPAGKAPTTQRAIRSDLLRVVVFPFFAQFP